MQNQQFEKLREKHPFFVYQNSSWKVQDNKFYIEFHYLIQPDIEFRHIITIRDLGNWQHIPVEILDRLVFNIGLLESFSYWKAACPRNVIIRPYPMSQDEVNLWKTLLEFGMGEFFYTNDIDFKEKNFVILHHDCHKPPPPHLISHTNSTTKPLLMVSGGKDSTFSGNFLRSIGEPFLCMMVNPTKTACHIAGVLGCETPIVIERKIDQRLLQLNQLGYLNGHIPFSAVLSVIGVLCATLHGCDKIVSSQEYGSSLPYVKHLQRNVNHQYSKSLHFENIFNKYVTKELVQNIEYFSLTRPLREIQIIHHLIRSDKELFAASKSCNRMLKENKWCLNCPKCLSVFTLAYPFLSEKEMEVIFGGNAFNELANFDVLEELFAINGKKRPFECVAPPDELMAAVWLGLKKHAIKEEAPPPVLNLARNILSDSNFNEDKMDKIMTFWSNDHLVPSCYAPLLKDMITTYNWHV